MDDKEFLKYYRNIEKIGEWSAFASLGSSLIWDCTVFTTKDNVYELILLHFNLISSYTSI